MAQYTSIEWADATFNPWRGCTKISDGCKNCYAEASSGRNPATFGEWGKNGRRVVASDSYWKMPHKWNADAAAGLCHDCRNDPKKRPGCNSCGGVGVFDKPYRLRIFCCSLADVFEDASTCPENDYPDVMSARVRLFKLIEETPQLDWMLLTKRSKNILKMIPAAWHHSPPPNWWQGVSAEDQKQWDIRCGDLIKTPALTRFVSVEPLIGEIDGSEYLGMRRADLFENVKKSYKSIFDGDADEHLARALHWILIGGESRQKGNVRDCKMDWVRKLMRQCLQTGTAVQIKQLGSMPMEQDPDDTSGPGVRLKLAHHKGEDIEEFPVDLRVRQTIEIYRAGGDMVDEPAIISGDLFQQNIKKGKS